MVKDIRRALVGILSRISSCVSTTPTCHPHSVNILTPREVSKLVSVASRPRFGCYSPARTDSAIQKVAEGSAGQAPAERGGLRQRGRPNVYIDVLLLRQVDSNKQCFHNVYAYLSAARNSIYRVALHFWEPRQS
jgi:hypothetical protein